MDEIIAGSASTLLGTILGWVLNNLSANSYKADLYFHVE